MVAPQRAYRPLRSHGSCRQDHLQVTPPKYQTWSMGGEGDGGGVQGVAREGRGMVVGFRGWPAPVHHDDPQLEEHHHQSSSLLYPCIAYISATLRDIDTKISGCIQIPKEHSLLHSYPHGQLHHRLHQHHQSASLLLPCIPYISANNRDIATKLSG